MDYSEQFTPRSDPSPGDHRIAPEMDFEEPGSAAEIIEEPEAASRVGSILYEIIETLLLALVIWLAVNFTTARYVVEGDSMEPNLHTGQFLIVSKLAYMDMGESFSLGAPQRGDVVVFDYPGNPGDDYVKRIVGLPGETVAITQEGVITIDGRPLTEPYISSIPYTSRIGEWTVPEDSYFVLGDNRNRSSDSRSWGMLEEQYIVGKAWLSYWPPNQIGAIPHYEYVLSQTLE